MTKLDFFLIFCGFGFGVGFGMYLMECHLDRLADNCERAIDNSDKLAKMLNELLLERKEKG